MMSRCASLAAVFAIGAPSSARAGNGQLRGSGWEETANASLGNSTGVKSISDQAMPTSYAVAGSPYILQSGYSCPTGYRHLDSSDECQYAAKQMVSNGNSLSVDQNTPSSSRNPQYCYVYGDSLSGFTHLYWNPDGVTSGSWTQRNVICKQDDPSYILQAGYSCPAGYQHLVSSGECQQAAKLIVPNGFSLSIDYNTPSSSGNPQYCYVYGDSGSGFTHLYWNPDGVTSGSWAQRNVICKKASGSNAVMIQWSHDQNYCLSVDNNNAAPGVKMQLWNCAGGAGQYFDLPPAGQLDYVKLHMNPSYCLVVDGNHNTNGARTQVWSPCRQYNQKWTLAPQGSNAHAPEYIFQWALGGKCLVVDGNRAFNGAKVNIWDCDRVPGYYKTWVAVSA